MRKTIMGLLLILIAFAAIHTSPVQAATQAQIDQAITKGVAWLAAKQNSDGSWGTWSTNRVGRTGLALVKLETHAIRGGKDPLDPSYPYYTNVTKGLEYLFLNASNVSIGMQTHGYPDTNGNNAGVRVGCPDSRVYETGVAMMAIAASTHPGKIVSVVGSAVNGATYKDVVQDAVDYLAWGQTDSGNGRGGWWYQESNNESLTSDNSISGYAVLGLTYAQALKIDGATGFSCTVPAFVKSELSIWIDYIQNDANGGSGYNSPDSWVNTLKTGNLLAEMAFFGDNTGDQRVIDATNYISSHWNDPDYIGWRGPGPGGNASMPACYQAMYCIMKGFEMQNIKYISPLNNPSGTDWYQDFANVLISQQNATDGSWPNAPLFGDTAGGVYRWDNDQILSTEWALLTLQKAAPSPIVVGGTAFAIPGLDSALVLYIGLVSTIAITAVATGAFARHAKHKKQKQ